MASNLQKLNPEMNKTTVRNSVNVKLSKMQLKGELEVTGGAYPKEGYTYILQNKKTIGLGDHQ